MTAMLDAALYLAGRGWRIFPCHHPLGSDVCSCRDPSCSKVGKHPALRDWADRAANDPATIRAFWQTWPDANIGFPTGVTNPVLVLDVDPRHGGDVSLAGLETRFGALPETLRTRTGSGGAHIFFDVVPGIGNSVGRVGPGLDVRSEGGYVVLPPSLHACGDRYEWSHVPDKIATAPDWIIALMSDLGSGGRVGGGSGRRKSADHWRRLLGVVYDGEGREAALVSLAGSLWRDGVSDGRLLPLLEQYNQRHCRPPKPKSDLRRIAKSIKRYAR